MNIVIGIGDYAVSDNEKDVLKTFALGSCVALTVYSPKKRVLGMAHIALPHSNIDIEASKNRPGHFADTAIPLLLDIFSSKYGCNKNDLVYNIYGGSKSIQANDIFKIGKRNVETIVDIFNKNNISLNKSETGGLVSRTIEADVNSGNVKLSIYPINI